jgi:ribonucleotide monophosphatase NagD (HAD superfamily)
MQKNRYWRTGEGLTLDAGPFVAALEYATGREATVSGKPSAAFFTGAADSMGLALSDVVVVGDDLASDVRGAIAAGARGALVRTGKSREADLDEPGRAPDAVIRSIADLPLLLGISG